MTTTRISPITPQSRGRARGRPWAAGMGLAALLGLILACGSPDLEVTKAQFGDAWPFAVDQGVLLCQTSSGGHVRSALLRVGETEYALNAAAETRGFDSVEPIWRNDPQFAGGHVDLKPMITLALQQC
jgi:hypothetical protein